MKMIPFNVATTTELEAGFLTKALHSGHISGDGWYTKACSKTLEEMLPGSRVLLTTSCTSALELAAILLEVQPGDEIIMPSYTFVSTANAFALRGAKIIFVDIRPDTMNIDEQLIEPAITPRTKVIVPVHYAGVSCNMDAILKIARKYNLYVVEDAAQGICSSYRGKPLGSFGSIGCLSFHETKNLSCGEGGAIILNDQRLVERAEIIREKGTDRSRFFRGKVDKYTWVDIGSSFLPSELNAAVLYAQLLRSDEIMQKRLELWNLYYQSLLSLQTVGVLELPQIPDDCEHNAHMFYVKVKDIRIRTALIEYLKNNGIMTTFHYVPLHSTNAGYKYGRFYGFDRFTTTESEKLLRLPIFYDLTEYQIKAIVNQINEFFRTTII